MPRAGAGTACAARASTGAGEPLYSIGTGLSEPSFGFS